MLTKWVERLFFEMGADAALDFLVNQTPTPEVCKLQDWVISRFCAVVDGAVEVRAHELD
jgi:hypothetical protein